MAFRSSITSRTIRAINRQAAGRARCGRNLRRVLDAARAAGAGQSRVGNRNRCREPARTAGGGVFLPARDASDCHPAPLRFHDRRAGRHRGAAGAAANRFRDAPRRRCKPDRRTDEVIRAGAACIGDHRRKPAARLHAMADRGGAGAGSAANQRRRRRYSAVRHHRPRAICRPHHPPAHPRAARPLSSAGRQSSGARRVG